MQQLKTGGHGIFDASSDGFRRRDLLRAGSCAAAVSAVDSLLNVLSAQQNRTQAPRRLRVDAHAHLWTDDYLDLVEEYGKKDTSVQRNKGAGPSGAEIEKRFAQMEAAGVEMQVLSVCPQAPHFDDKVHATTAARKINDLYAEVVHKYPKRFKALVALPLPHVDEALKELDRVLDPMGALGVSTTTTVAGRSIADPAFSPLYEELDRRGTVLYVHPAGASGHTPMIADYHVTWMIGAPIEDTISTTHLIIKGIPQKYPSMRIVNSHLGGALPMVLQRMDNQYGWENPETPEKPSITARRMWFDTVAHAHPPAIRAAVDTLGADRIILGTDFPYESGELYQHAISYIANAGLKQADSTRILDYNGAKVLRLA
jgi:predicted TIM-barrel fold metal-dependent hydrolase